MASGERSIGRSERIRMYKRRTAAIAGGLTVPALAAGVGLALLLPSQSNAQRDTNRFDGSPGSTAPLDPSPSPSVTDSKPVFPQSSGGSKLPEASEPSPTSSASDFCETQHNPIEGSFDQNTGVHTVYATSEHQSIVVVTPDRSAVQQLKWRLRGQSKWTTLDPGETGIVLRTQGDMEIDTGGNRAAWFKECEGTPKDAEDEVPSRVADVFKNWGFGCVNVYTIFNGEGGYRLQAVRNGEQYTQQIPHDFYPFQ